MKIAAWFLLFCLMISSGLADEGRTVRILTIGNSFSRNATNHLEALAKAGGHTLIHRPIVVGGASLELHTTKAQRHEADPENSDGLYTNGRSLKQELLSEPWDFVTIQQASIRSHDLGTYEPFASWLAAYVAEHAPTAKLMVHQTWAYRVDDPRFRKGEKKEREPRTQAEMYQGLRKAYYTIAEQLHAGVIPVGDAFYRADTDEEWAYRPEASFTTTRFQYPHLPEQRHSLHVGWRWVKDKNSGQQALRMDGHHANLEGEYLGACVWYEVLFDDRVEGNPYFPSKIARPRADFLQQVAHLTVAALPDHLN